MYADMRILVVTPNEQSDTDMTKQHATDINNACAAVGIPAYPTASRNELAARVLDRAGVLTSWAADSGDAPAKSEHADAVATARAILAA